MAVIDGQGVLTVCRVAPQRAAERIGEGRVRAVEAVERTASLDAAVICSTAAGYSLHLSGLAA
jgi:hypothetical protein